MTRDRRQVGTHIIGALEGYQMVQSFQKNNLTGADMWVESSVLTRLLRVQS